MSLWNPYQPSSSAPWDLKRALHLHRRVVFGACWDEVQRDLDEDPQRTVTRLLDGYLSAQRIPKTSVRFLFLAPSQPVNHRGVRQFQFGRFLG